MREFNNEAIGMRSEGAALQCCVLRRQLFGGTQIAVAALATLILSLGAIEVSSASDIRGHEKEGVRELVNADVLRGTQIVRDQGRLIVGERFFDVTPRAQRRLAQTAFEFLKRGADLSRGMVLVDGRTGRVFASYDPERGLEAR